MWERGLKANPEICRGRMFFHQPSCWERFKMGPSHLLYSLAQDSELCFILSLTLLLGRELMAPKYLLHHNSCVPMWTLHCWSIPRTLPTAECLCQLNFMPYIISVHVCMLCSLINSFQDKNVSYPVLLPSPEFSSIIYVQYILSKCQVKYKRVKKHFIYFTGVSRAIPGEKFLVQFPLHLSSVTLR